LHFFSRRAASAPRNPCATAQNADVDFRVATQYVGPGFTQNDRSPLHVVAKTPGFQRRCLANPITIAIDFKTRLQESISRPDFNNWQPRANFDKRRDMAWIFLTNQIRLGLRQPSA
jgi:hypothetical protein